MPKRSPHFLLLLGLGAFITLGMPEGVLGTAWPFLRSDLDRSLAELGEILAAGTIAFVIGASTVASAIRKFGLGRVLTLAVGIRLVAFAGFALAEVWPVILASAFFLGLGGGWQDSGFNIDFALHRGVRAMNLLHAMFGVGATLGPLLVIGFAPQWRPAFWLLAAAQLAVLVAVATSRRSWSMPPPVQSTQRRIQPSIVALFFLYTGAEVAGGQWAFTLLFEGRGIAEGAAGRWVALYWGGVTVGRLVLGFSGDRIGLRRIVDWGLACGSLGFLLLWLDPAGAGVWGLPLAGVGLAPLFPAFVAMTPTLAGLDQVDSAVGYQLAAAGLGGASLPWIFGVTAEATSLEAIPLLLVGSVAVLALLWVSTSRRRAPSVSERRGRQAPRA